MVGDIEKLGQSADVPIVVTEPVFIENTEPLPLPIFVSFACEKPQKNPYHDT
jgi:hypothetical protein